MKNKKSLVQIIVLILIIIVPVAIILFTKDTPKELKLDNKTKLEVTAKEGEKPKIFSEEELTNFLKNAKDKDGNKLSEDIKLEKAEFNKKNEPSKIIYTLNITNKDGSTETKTLTFDVKYIKEKKQKNKKIQDKDKETTKPNKVEKEEKPETKDPEIKNPSTDADR